MSVVQTAMKDRPARRPAGKKASVAVEGSVMVEARVRRLGNMPI